MTWTGQYACHLGLATGEVKDYTRDFSAELINPNSTLPDFTITAFSIVSVEADLTITNPAVNGGLVSCQLSLPKAATTYGLWFTVELSNGNILTPLPILITSQERPA